MSHYLEKSLLREIFSPVPQSFVNDRLLIFLCLLIYLYTHIYTYIHIYIFIYMYKCIYIYIYIYIYMYVFLLMYILYMYENYKSFAYLYIQGSYVLWRRLQLKLIRYYIVYTSAFPIMYCAIYIYILYKVIMKAKNHFCLKRFNVSLLQLILSVLIHI